MDALKTSSKNGQWPSVSALSAPLVKSLEEDAKALRLETKRGPLGELLIDCGANVPGGLEAGRRIAEICLGGLGTVTLQGGEIRSSWPLSVTVHSTNPVAACLGSQYAGWTLADGDYYVLGSGPGRAAGSKEPLFEELGYRDKHDEICLVLETDQAPPEAVVKEVAEACGVSPSQLTFVYAPTSSLAGNVQVVARVLEVALHKAHELHFPLENIVDGVGIAPICPPHPEFVQAMGRTNDAIIFGGRVQLYVTGTSSDAKDLANKLPSSTSKDYGTPFAKIFERVKGDFYAIDPMLFSPAMVSVTCLDTGETFVDGRIDDIALRQSFTS